MIHEKPKRKPKRQPRPAYWVAIPLTVLVLVVLYGTYLAVAFTRNATTTNWVVTAGDHNRSVAVLASEFRLPPPRGMDDITTVTTTTPRHEWQGWGRIELTPYGMLEFVQRQSCFQGNLNANDRAISAVLSAWDDYPAATNSARTILGGTCQMHQRYYEAVLVQAANTDNWTIFLYARAES